MALDFIRETNLITMDWLISFCFQKTKWGITEYMSVMTKQSPTWSLQIKKSQLNSFSREKNNRLFHANPAFPLIVGVTPKISFSLRKTKNPSRCHIQMVVAFGFCEDTIYGTDRKHRYLRLNTGRLIKLESWNNKESRPSLEHSMKDKLKLHHFLDEQEKLMSQAIQIVVDSPYAVDITPDSVKTSFFKKSGKLRTRVVKVSIVKDIEEFIATSDLKHLTTANYNGLVLQLTDFERVKKQILYWHQFNQKVFDEFLDFLSSQKYEPTTLWGFQKRLVAAFNRAKKRELIPPSLFLEKRFKYKTPDKSYLNWDQVAEVLKHEPETKALRDIQTHFAVMALTGIRYSDLTRFYRNYEEGTAFDFSNFKVTKSPSPEILVAALLPIKKALKNGFPSVPSNGQLNLKLKVLCGQVLPYSIAKTVSCHALRRSFVTNMLSLSVIPEHVIAKLTGHAMSKELSVFHSYNKISLFENAQVFVRLLSTVDFQQTGGLRLVRFVEQELMN